MFKQLKKIPSGIFFLLRDAIIGFFEQAWSGVRGQSNHGDGDHLPLCAHPGFEKSK
jgi:hypothetical protein